MTFQARPFYSSSNGDRWLLVPNPGSGRSLVRHEPNRSSGGSSTDIEIDEFFLRDGQGPQHTALRTLLDAEPLLGSRSEPGSAATTPERQV
jgi:hypothetical protein